MRSRKIHWSLALLLYMGCLPLTAVADLQTVRVERQETTREFLVHGTVEAIHRTTVSAQTSGQVEEILFDVDDFVNQGQVLMRLKDTEQKARLDQAEADLKETIARLQEAEEEFTRVRGLHERRCRGVRHRRVH